MGMGDGPVLMPDGTTMDAASVPSMAQMAALGDDDDEALRMMMGGMGGAGLLGLGGGELMAPLLLALGMLPQVASATSAFMIFFTSGANLVTYLAQGVLTPDLGYVVWIVTLGFCSAMVGRLSSVFITTRLRHPSFIVLTLGAILLVSMFLLIARVAQVEPQWAFSALCPTD